MPLVYDPIAGNWTTGADPSQTPLQQMQGQQVSGMAGGSQQPLGQTAQLGSVPYSTIQQFQSLLGQTQSNAESNGGPSTPNVQYMNAQGQPVSFDQLQPDANGNVQIYTNPSNYQQGGFVPVTNSGQGWQAADNADTSAIGGSFWKNFVIPAAIVATAGAGMALGAGAAGVGGAAGAAGGADSAAMAAAAASDAGGGSIAASGAGAGTAAAGSGAAATTAATVAPSAVAPAAATTGSGLTAQQIASGLSLAKTGVGAVSDAFGGALGNIIGPAIGTATAINAGNQSAAVESAAAQQALANTQNTQVGNTNIANQAIGQTNANTNSANTAVQQSLAASQALQQPYLDTGTNALAKLNSGDSSQILDNDPGYQFRLQQGLLALNNSAAAKGAIVGGNAMNDVNNYAQGQASQEYAAAWSRLSGLAGIGQTAANTMTGANQAAGQSQANNFNTNSSQNNQTLGNLASGDTTLNAQGNAAIGDAADATAQGYVSTANAVNAGIANAQAANTSSQYLNKLSQQTNPLLSGAQSSYTNPLTSSGGVYNSVGNGTNALYDNGGNI